MAAILENGCQFRHRSNLRWPYSQISPRRCILTVCQISCFYHQTHNHFTYLLHYTNKCRKGQLKNIYPWGEFFMGVHTTKTLRSGRPYYKPLHLQPSVAFMHTPRTPAALYHFWTGQFIQDQLLEENKQDNGMAFSLPWQKPGNIIASSITDTYDLIGPLLRAWQPSFKG